MLSGQLSDVWEVRERGAWGRLGVFGLRQQEGELASVGEE